MGYFIMGIAILVGLNILVLSFWLRIRGVISRTTDWIVTSILFAIAFIIGINADKILGL